MVGATRFNLLRFFLFAHLVWHVDAFFFDRIPLLIFLWIPMFFPPLECYVRFFFLGFEGQNLITAIDTFAKISVMVYDKTGETGEYKGAEGIEEYIKNVSIGFTPFE